MQINLTKDGGATIPEVRDLLRSKDDSQHRQLRVTPSGMAFLSDEVGSESVDGLRFRFETWLAGNQYCGAAAADDDKWVQTVCNDLNKNWPNPEDSYIDW